MEVSVATWRCVWQHGVEIGSVDAFLPFSFPPLIVLCTFRTISFFLRKFFHKYFPKVVLRKIIS